MPGKLGKNLRQGHLAEDLGIIFLRSFCAVSDIRQEDDIGIDALATLLNEKDKILYAEETFSVQIKAKSVEKITYDGKALEWLLNQSIPLFFLSVDLRTSSFDVYTTNPVYELLLHKEVRSATLVLEKPSQWYSRLEREENHANIKIGPPILSTNLQNIRSESHLKEIYNLIKTWLIMEISQAGFRKLNKSKQADWDTWNEPIYRGTISFGNQLNLKKDMDTIEPYISYLSNHIAFNQELKKTEVATAFLIIQKWFNENGVELDLEDKLLLNKAKELR